MTRQLKLLDALDGDERVPVSEAEPRERYECPQCGGELTTVAAHKRGDCAYVRQHFSHLSDACSYETPEHRRMKINAALYAQQRWPDAEVHHEDVTPRTIAGLRPDVVVEFDEGGVCIEAQWRNEGKDVRHTERRYAAAGYHTLWTHEVDAADDDDFDMTRADEYMSLFAPDLPDDPCPHQSFDRETAVVPAKLPGREWRALLIPETESSSPARECAVVPVTMRLSWHEPEQQEELSQEWRNDGVDVEYDSWEEFKVLNS